MCVIIITRFLLFVYVSVQSWWQRRGSWTRWAVTAPQTPTAPRPPAVKTAPAAATLKMNGLLRHLRPQRTTACLSSTPAAPTAAPRRAEEDWWTHSVSSPLSSIWMSNEACPYLERVIVSYYSEIEVDRLIGPINPIAVLYSSGKVITAAMSLFHLHSSSVNSGMLQCYTVLLPVGVFRLIARLRDWPTYCLVGWRHELNFFAGRMLCFFYFAELPPIKWLVWTRPQTVL